MDQVEVAVARLEVQVEKLEADMLELKGDIKAIRAKLDKADGGLMMLLMVGSACATIGAILAKFIDWKF
jgi:hypothetical protein